MLYLSLFVDASLAIQNPIGMTANVPLLHGAILNKPNSEWHANEELTRVGRKMYFTKEKEQKSTTYRGPRRALRETASVQSTYNFEENIAQMRFNGDLLRLRTFEYVENLARIEKEISDLSKQVKAFEIKYNGKTGNVDDFKDAAFELMEFENIITYAQPKVTYWSKQTTEKDMEGNKLVDLEEMKEWGIIGTDLLTKIQERLEKTNPLIIEALSKLALQNTP